MRGAGKACQRIGVVGSEWLQFAVNCSRALAVEMALPGDLGCDLASGWRGERTNGKGGRGLQKGWVVADQCRGVVARMVVERSIFW